MGTQTLRSNPYSKKVRKFKKVFDSEEFLGTFWGGRTLQILT